jgi:hypothetical protein
MQDDGSRLSLGSGGSTLLERASQLARIGLGAALALLLARASSGDEGDRAVPELKSACEFCVPGKPPPPPEVQEELRRLNADANWREPRAESDVIQLGPATRMQLRRAWSSGRFQGVLGESAPQAGAARPRVGFAPSARGSRSASLADRSTQRRRQSLGDRRDSRRRGREDASSSERSGRSSLSSGRSSSSSSRSSGRGTLFESSTSFDSDASMFDQ